MILEVGKQYFTRIGERVTVLRKVANPDYPMVVQTIKGEEMFTMEGHFDKFEDSQMDIVRPACPPLPTVVAAAQQPTPCLSRYCTNDADGGELCETCRFLVRSGKSLPKPHAEHEPKVINFSGEGWEVTLREITSHTT
jgi:hypothetical protein